MRRLKTIGLALVSAAGFAVAISIVGLEGLLAAFAGARADHAAAAAALVLANAILSLLRFRSVLQSLGHAPAWRDLFCAFAIGQVSNQFLLNIIGQSLSRGAVLAAAGVPFAVSVVATYIERVVAAGFLFLASLVAAAYLFDRVGLDLRGGGAYLLSLAGGMAATAIAVGMVVFRRRMFDRGALRQAAAMLRFWPCAALTALAHGCMLGAYILALIGLGADGIAASAVAALTIVMFTASLPISFSGWGIRELSAAKALGAVGIAAPVAVAGAVIVGLLGLALLLLFAAIGAAWALVRRRELSLIATGAARTGAAWNDALMRVCTFAVAAFVFFSLRVPLERGEVTVNVADPAALTAFGLFAVVAWTRRTIAPAPLWFGAGLGAISALIAGSLLLGYFYRGPSDWAFVNRGLGWIVILGYVAAGAALATVAGQAARIAALKVFIVAGLTICALQLLLLAASAVGARLPAEIFASPLQGYANNSNAFAFQVAMAGVALVVALRLGLFAARARQFAAAFVLLALTIFYTQSRAGHALLLLIGAVMCFVVEPPRRRLACQSAAAALAAICAAAALPLIDLVSLAGFFFGPELAEYVSRVGASLPEPRISHAGSDAERWQTIRDGLALWRQYPLFGAGLGGYVEQRLASGHSFQVIHSIPVWLLAETGLVGATVPAIFALAALRWAFRRMRDPGSAAWAAGTLGVLLCIGGAGLVHDLSYQRSFWFLLALFVAGAASQARPAPVGAGLVSPSDGEGAGGVALRQPRRAPSRRCRHWADRRARRVFALFRAR